MSGQSGQQPIIIIKKKGHGGHGHHGGAWKVAYADFVTAMMAFFLVMWIIAQSKETKAAVGGYFRDPVAFEAAQGAGSGILPGVQSGVTGGGKAVGATDVEAANEALKQAAEHLREALAKTPGFDKLKDRVEITITDEGLRIELREAPNDGFFDSGSAVAKPEMITLLGVIAEELAQLPNKVAVEGHTDSKPYAGKGQRYTNWELSADRANAARRIIQQRGVAEVRIDAVRGYADTRLRVADPFDAGNRRISIVVRRDDTKRQQAPVAAKPLAAPPLPPSSH
jgi:chemotaxis protein MotB